MNKTRLNETEKKIVTCLENYKHKLPQNELQWKLCDYDVNLCERAIRTYIKSINDKYNAGKIDFMVISDKYGCWLSQDPIEIRLYNNRKRANALSLLKSAWDSEKRMRNDVNLSFNDYLNEIEKGAL